MKILFKIENIDKDKSYSHLKEVKEINEKNEEFCSYEHIPVYPNPNDCLCQYGYNCDTEVFNEFWNTPYYYKKVLKGKTTSY